jgi:hypothetical protein
MGISKIEGKVAALKRLYKQITDHFAAQGLKS